MKIRYWDDIVKNEKIIQGEYSGRGFKINFYLSPILNEKTLHQIFSKIAELKLFRQYFYEFYVQLYKNDKEKNISIMELLCNEPKFMVEEKNACKIYEKILSEIFKEVITILHKNNHKYGGFKFMLELTDIFKGTDYPIILPKNLEKINFPKPKLEFKL